MTENNNNQIKKFPKEKCIENFKKYILGNEINTTEKTYIYNNKQDLLSFGIKGDFSSIYLRPMAYKIFLNHLPIDKSIQQWISIIFNNRKSYSQLKSKYFPSQSKNKNSSRNSNNSSNLNNIKNVIDNNNASNKENDDELKKLIDLDLSRTFQEISLFKEEKVLKILFNILYIYSKEHLETNPYKQGMNEIISILFLSVYPCYFTCKNNISKNDMINTINSFNKKINIKLSKNNQNGSTKKYGKKYIIQPTNNKNELEILFNFFHDDNYLEVDLYYLFNDLMDKGFNVFFKDDFFEKRCDNIINNKLKIIDFELYKHCTNIKVPYHIFLGKWIQSFFAQIVTNIDKRINILDVIISKEFLHNDINTDIYMIKKNDLYEFEFLDCICLAMIKKYREELLKKNDEEFLIFCLCYPLIETNNEIIQSSNSINMCLKKSNIDINKINENTEKKPSLKITPKKILFYGKEGRNNLNFKTNSCYSEFKTNYYKKKKLGKHNTIFGKIDIKKRGGNTSSSKAFTNSEKGNKSTKILDSKKSSIKEISKFSFFDKINSFSHQFDQYKCNDLIDTYYF